MRQVHDQPHTVDRLVTLSFSLTPVPGTSPPAWPGSNRWRIWSSHRSSEVVRTDEQEHCWLFWVLSTHGGPAPGTAGLLLNQSQAVSPPDRPLCLLGRLFSEVGAPWALNFCPGGGCSFAAWAGVSAWAPAPAQGHSDPPELGVLASLPWSCSLGSRAKCHKVLQWPERPQYCPFWPAQTLHFSVSGMPRLYWLLLPSMAHSGLN